MKVFITSILFITTWCLPQFAQAQYITRLVTTNSNGAHEYLYYDARGDIFQYASDANLTKVRLVKVEKTTGSDGYPVYKVKFPGNQAIYILNEGITRWLCTNPDGSVQTFTIESEYLSVTKGVKEYLYTSGINAISFRYRTAKSKKYIDLILVSGDMTKDTWKVRFPNSNKIYVIQGVMEGYKCTNPDGSVQIFRHNH